MDSEIVYYKEQVEKYRRARNQYNKTKNSYEIDHTELLNAQKTIDSDKLVTSYGRILTSWMSVQEGCSGTKRGELDQGFEKLCSIMNEYTKSFNQTKEQIDEAIKDCEKKIKDLESQIRLCEQKISYYENMIY